MMTMTATACDITIEQGSDLDLTIQVWADVAHTVIQSLNGWEAKMMVKSSKGPGATTLVSLTSNPANGLVINGPAGQVTIFVNGTTTGGYTWLKGLFDLKIYNPSTGSARRVLQGSVLVDPQITI